MYGDLGGAAELLILPNDEVQVEWIILNKVNLTMNSAGSNWTTKQIVLDLRRSSKRSGKVLHKPKFLDQLNSQGYLNARNVVTNVATSLT